MRVVVQRGGCPPGGWEAGRRVRLDDEEIHHLKVRRARDGEAVEVLDGAGLQGAGTLVRIGRAYELDTSVADTYRRKFTES